MGFSWGNTELGTEIKSKSYFGNSVWFSPETDMKLYTTRFQNRNAISGAEFLQKYGEWSVQVGQEYTGELLNAWARNADNFYSTSINRWMLSERAVSINKTYIVKNVDRVHDGRGYFTVDSYNSGFAIKGFMDFVKRYNTKPVEKMDIKMIKVWVGDDKELHTKIYNRLIELGSKPDESVRNSYFNAIYIGEKLNTMHSKNSYDHFANDLPEYRIVEVKDLLPEYNTININNNLKTTNHEHKEGTAIIVHPIIATIRTGQRPTGSPVRSRGRNATIRVGHLSNQAVHNSSAEEPF